MKEEERYKLLFGPYYPPKVRRGSIHLPETEYIEPW
jgi:hypothetical protein